MTSPGCVHAPGSYRCTSTLSGVRGESPLEGLLTGPSGAGQLWPQTKETSAMAAQAACSLQVGLKDRGGWRGVGCRCCREQHRGPCPEVGRSSVTRTPPLVSQNSVSTPKGREARACLLQDMATGWGEGSSAEVWPAAWCHPGKPPGWSQAFPSQWTWAPLWGHFLQKLILRQKFKYKWFIWGWLRETAEGQWGSETGRSMYHWTDLQCRQLELHLAGHPPETR